MNACAVIPCYNHEGAVSQTVAECLEVGLPVILVDDGSDEPCRGLLTSLAEGDPERITLFRLDTNQGKGSAVSLALREAFRAGFSHAVQVDADGQHRVTDVPAMLQLAATIPGSAVCGQAEFGPDAPRARVVGRWVTHFWVWIHTLSFAIADSMCGFRVYPLAETEALLEKHKVAARMDFDTDIIVRLFWRGVPVQNFRTNVRYPRDGRSHFNMLRDNLRISRTHARLFLGMLVRLPWLLSLRLMGKR